MIEDEHRGGHWRQSIIWAAIALAVVFLLAFLAPLNVDPLNRLIVLGFPLGFFLAAQGALIVLVILAFWFTNRQERTDRRHGASEDL
ncbi:MAG: DUF4212 domain-containing protein [Geminicoccaceae bacterium]